jgi:hypothetical protein
LVELLRHRLSLAVTDLPTITREQLAPIELAKETIKRLKDALT